MPITKDINLKTMAKETPSYSGADIDSIAREAGLNALRENINSKSVNSLRVTNNNTAIIYMNI